MPAAAHTDAFAALTEITPEGERRRCSRAFARRPPQSGRTPDDSTVCRTFANLEECAHFPPRAAAPS
ncbi:hypothetical protein C3488_11285 [Streptomyces sp. Ru72]|nr:hypothetical protein C3488_11285 [Streptomyces sp. Ru72]